MRLTSTPLRRAALALGLSLLSALPAAADISRGCSAHIDVWGPTVPSGRQPVMELDASGTCSRVNPDDCRRRAFGALRECTAALWVARNNHDIPSQCQTGSGGDRRINWTRFPGIYRNLPHGQNSMIDRVRNQACCASGATGVVYVRVNRTIIGDDGCGGGGNFSQIWTEDFDATYRVDCGHQRAIGICGAVPRRTNP
ncbi:hypothetical protein LCM17_14880 [Cereibacter sphaeroides]|nr:hypothetical protein [Cereibacter sphaeroides]